MHGTPSLLEDPCYNGIELGEKGLPPSPTPHSSPMQCHKDCFINISKCPSMSIEYKVFFPLTPK